MNNRFDKTSSTFSRRDASTLGCVTNFRFWTWLVVLLSFSFLGSMDVEQKCLAAPPVETTSSINFAFPGTTADPCARYWVKIGEEAHYFAAQDNGRVRLSS